RDGVDFSARPARERSRCWRRRWRAGPMLTVPDSGGVRILSGAATAEVLGSEVGIAADNTAKGRTEMDARHQRQARLTELRQMLADIKAHRARAVRRVLSCRTSSTSGRLQRLSGPDHSVLRGGGDTEPPS